MIADLTISYQTALEIANRSRIVKILALIDIFFSFLSIMLNPYFFIHAFISLVFGLIGYNGANKYNKCQVGSYLAYLTCQVIFTTIFFFAIIFNPSFFGYSRITPFFIGINTINILLSIYINYFIYKFYKLISNYNQDALSNLIEDVNIVVVHSSPV